MEETKRRKKGRGKKGMKSKGGREEPLKRGKKGMNNEQRQEEQWKRGKAKTEQREGEMTDKVEKEKSSRKISKASEASF